MTMQHATNHVIRVWDLPTRLFHWTLVVTTGALVISAKVGGNAMQLHLNLGYFMVALLAFRLVWGLVGGHWSRFRSFFYSPAQLKRYLQEKPESVGHSPSGALAVFALLTILLLQVLSGLMTDDEIAFAGSLTRIVSGDWISLASWYHSDVGQYLLMGIVALHILAIVFFVTVRKRTLVRPMLHGDKHMAQAAISATDSVGTRIAALLLLLACGAFAWWVAGIGAQAMLG